MAGKKYVADYRLEKAVTPSGKIQTRQIYQGQYYCYARSRETLSRLKKQIYGVVLTAAALILPLMMTGSELGRTFYVVMPVAAAIVPLYKLAAGARRLGFPEEKFTREHRDKTQNRIARASMWLSILLSLAAGGSIYACVRMMAEEVLLCATGLVLAWGASLTLLPFRGLARAIPVRETEN